MIPFRIYDRAEKSVWIVVHYQSNSERGDYYLMAKEEDDPTDGEFKLVPAADIVNYRMVDFLDETQGSEGQMLD